MLLLQKRKTQGDNLLAGSWWCLFLGCAFFICLTTGCKEPPSSPKVKEVVRRKIPVQKETKAKLAESKKDTPSPVPETVQKETPPPVSKESQQPTTQPVLEEGQKTITEPVTKEEQEPEKAVYSYNPEGKVDPFRPIISSRAKGGPPGSRKRPDRMVPLTPLQKIAINQVKLVGIIMSPKGNKAVVQDAAGKGYIITKGAYIGMNFGKVARILKNKVVLHEEFEDYISGRIKTREVTLELPQKYNNGSMQ